MAEQMDLKTFYYLTLPIIENIRRLHRATVSRSFSKQQFLDYSNQTFGMLAHLQVDSPEKLFEKKSFEEFSAILMICKNLRIVNENSILNPSAVPMIQRYIKIFEVYEQQNGIVNPYVKE